MTATSWGDLFERAASYDVDLERIRARAVSDDPPNEDADETNGDGSFKGDDRARDREDDDD
ncbi:hypothetical protein [Halopiger thermotolerans]